MKSPVTEVANGSLRKGHHGGIGSSPDGSVMFSRTGGATIYSCRSLQSRFQFLKEFGRASCSLMEHVLATDLLQPFFHFLFPVSS